MKKLFTIIAFLMTVAIASAQPLGPGGIYGGGGGTGNVTSTSDAQTWGGGTGPVVWTFSVTGTDPTISVATGAFTFNTDLALGANDITMTGSLGATGAGKLTKIWAVDAEFTNAPTVNGAAFKPADLAIASQAAGDVLYFNGTNWVRLAKDAGKYLKSGDAAVSWDTPAGSGTVDVSGTPANHYWTGWTDADTIKGFAITASKPVCSDASGDPVVCAGTEGVWQVAGSYSTTTMATDAIWAAAGDLAYGTGNDTASKLAIGTAGQVLKVNSGATAPEWTSSLSVTIDDSAAQFKSATASKGTLKFDQTGLTDGKVLTIKHTSADDYTYTPTFTGNTAITFPTSGTLAVTSGALGTPSFTALNIPSGTGDAGTTAGQIVHDNNDTAGSANGNLEWFDGTNVRSIIDTGTTYTVITKTEFLPIAWAVDGATAPSAIAAVTGKEINARSFTEGDDVVFWWVVPNDYVGGVKYRVHYALSANASADETVIFSMAGSIVANSGDLDGSAGTALTITDELGTDDDQYQYMVTDYSAESNADWSLSAGGLARLNFSNAAAGDLASGEPLVIGIEIKYKAKIIGIAGY